MPDSWDILRWAWTGVLGVWCLFQILADKRLHGHEKKRSRNIGIVMVILVAIRICIQKFFGVGLTYRLVVLFVGIAAGIAALVLAKLLIEQRELDGRADAEGVESGSGR